MSASGYPKGAPKGAGGTVVVVVRGDSSTAHQVQSLLNDHGLDASCHQSARGLLDVQECVEVLATEFRLSRRERQVVHLVLLGRTSPEIAKTLGIGAGTVKTHLQRIWDKMGVRSRHGVFALLLQPEGETAPEYVEVP